MPRVTYWSSINGGSSSGLRANTFFTTHFKKQSETKTINFDNNAKCMDQTALDGDIKSRSNDGWDHDDTMTMT